MKLHSIQIYNFRCFEQLTINFEPHLTVIVAENGIGKTTILDAIALGFGRFLTKLPKVKGIASRETDIRIEQGEIRAPFMNVLFKTSNQEQLPVHWTIQRKRDATAKTAKAVAALLNPDIALVGQKQIDDYAASLAESDATGNAYFLPMIAYYGTNRAVLEEVQRRRNYKKQFNRFDALSGALQADARFKAAFEWFNNMEDAERRTQQEQRNFDYRLPELNTVRSAIVSILPPGFSKPRTEIRPLRFVIDRMMPDGIIRTFRLNQLSDGFRVMLGLVMDLARRMAQANTRMAPNAIPISNPLTLPAIVLIDEVDLHLHPKWQQTVLTDLMRTFRNTQFIVTTHSPQVLTTVRKENIRVLSTDENGVSHADMPDISPIGREAGDALAYVMATQPRPQLALLADVHRYEQAVRAGQEESAEALEIKKKLDTEGYEIPATDLVTWRFLASRRARQQE